MCRSQAAEGRAPAGRSPVVAAGVASGCDEQPVESVGALGRASGGAARVGGGEGGGNVVGGGVLLQGGGRLGGGGQCSLEVRSPTALLLASCEGRPRRGGFGWRGAGGCSLRAAAILQLGGVETRPRGGDQLLLARRCGGWQVPTFFID